MRLAVNRFYREPIIGQQVPADAYAAAAAGRSATQRLSLLRSRLRNPKPHYAGAAAIATARREQQYSGYPEPALHCKNIDVMLLRYKIPERLVTRLDKMLEVDG